MGNDPINRSIHENLTGHSRLDYQQAFHHQRLGPNCYMRPWTMYDSFERTYPMPVSELAHECNSKRSSNTTFVASENENFTPFYQNDGSFSRAVSTSFGEVPKRNFDGRIMNGETTTIARQDESDHHIDYRSRISDVDSESSWKALHQVASVDEENFYRQFSKNHGQSPIPQNDEIYRRESPFEGIQLSSSSLSNSSSSTFINSFPTPSKLIRLNSLSSIASTQKPLETCVTYDSKTQSAYSEHEDTSISRKRQSPKESDSVKKKSRCSSPSSFTNFHGPCFTLSLDSMNSFSTDEINQSHTLAPCINADSKPFLSEIKSSWDLGDRIVGTFTFDTCESVGDSSSGYSNNNHDQMINQSISSRFDLSTFHTNESHIYDHTTQEKRNPSFDSYFDPRINNWDGKRDESISSKSTENREDITSSQPLAPHVWNYPYAPSYSSSNYRQPVNYGQNIVQVPKAVDNRYPQYVSQDGAKVTSNVDFRSYWPHYGYIYPHYSSIESWRLPINNYCGKNGNEVVTGPPNSYHPKVYNKWSAEDDVLLTSIMKKNKYDEGDFESVAADIGRGKS